MDAEKLLKRPEKLDRQIEVIKLEIKEQRLMLYDLGGFDYSTDRVMSSGSSGASYEKRLETIDRLERDLIYMLTIYEEVLEGLRRLFRKLLSPRERTYARLRWLEFRSNSEISKIMKLRGKNSARNYEKKIIEKFKEYLENEDVEK